MTWQDWLTLGSIAGVIAAIVWGRRKGRQRLSMNLAAARAEGHAQATAELSAKLVNHVQVVAGNSLPGEVGRESDAIVSALRFLAVEQSRYLGTHDDYAAAGDDLATLVGRTGGQHGDDQQPSDRAPRVIARDGSVRDLDSGSAVIL